MRHKTTTGLMIIALLLPSVAGAVSEEDFKIDNTENLPKPKDEFSNHAFSRR